MEQPAPAFVPALDHAHLFGPVSSDRGGAVRRAPKNIQPEDVAVEMVGQKFRLRERFTDGAINVPAAEVVTVTSWDNASSTVEVTSPSVKGSYHVPKYLLDPERVTAKEIAPYGVGLGKVKTSVERGGCCSVQEDRIRVQDPEGKGIFCQRAQRPPRSAGQPGTHAEQTPDSGNDAESL